MATETLRTVCNRDCPDACGLIATVEDGKLAAEGDELPVLDGGDQAAGVGAIPVANGAKRFSRHGGIVESRRGARRPDLDQVRPEVGQRSLPGVLRALFTVDAGARVVEEAVRRAAEDDRFDLFSKGLQRVLERFRPGIY